MLPVGKRRPYCSARSASQSGTPSCSQLVPPLPPLALCRARSASRILLAVWKSSLSTAICSAVCSWLASVSDRPASSGAAAHEHCRGACVCALLLLLIADRHTARCLHARVLKACRCRDCAGDGTVRCTSNREVRVHNRVCGGIADDNNAENAATSFHAATLFNYQQTLLPDCDLLS